VNVITGDNLLSQQPQITERSQTMTSNRMLQDNKEPT